MAEIVLHTVYIPVYKVREIVLIIIIFFIIHPITKYQSGNSNIWFYWNS